MGPELGSGNHKAEDCLQLVKGVEEDLVAVFFCIIYPETCEPGHDCNSNYGISTSASGRASAAAHAQPYSSYCQGIYSRIADDHIRTECLRLT